MISAEALYRALISLVDIGDGELFATTFKGRDCDVQPEAMETLLPLVPDITRIIESYDYRESSEFLASCIGKSTEYVAMKRRLESDGHRRRSRKEHLLAALHDLRTSDGALGLVSASDRCILDKVRSYLIRSGAKA